MGSVSVTQQMAAIGRHQAMASWITITSGSTGSGNGTVNYSVSPNTSTSLRTGTMTIAGKTFTATQSGVGASPAPDVKANGTDTLINITSGDNLLVTVELNAGSNIGLNADWWVAQMFQVHLQLMVGIILILVPLDSYLSAILLLILLLHTKALYLT